MESPVPALPSQDAEHLKLLALFHYIVGGIGFFFACFPIIHLIVGIVLLYAPTKPADGAAPQMMVAVLFIGLALFFIVCGWALAFCTILSGRKIAQHKSWLFSMVIAGVLCLFMPFGTVLGVFTIVILNKESVKLLYRSRAATPS